MQAVETFPSTDVRGCNSSLSDSFLLIPIALLSLGNDTPLFLCLIAGTTGSRRCESFTPLRNIFFAVQSDPAKLRAAVKGCHMLIHQEPHNWCHLDTLIAL